MTSPPILIEAAIAARDDAYLLATLDDHEVKFLVVGGKEPPKFDPRAMLRPLCPGGVAFIVIGSVAAVLHGSPFPTYGLDMYYVPATTTRLFWTRLSRPFTPRARRRERTASVATEHKPGASS